MDATSCTAICNIPDEKTAYVQATKIHQGAVDRSLLKNGRFEATYNWDMAVKSHPPDITHVPRSPRLPPPPPFFILQAIKMWGLEMLGMRLYQRCQQLGPYYMYQPMWQWHWILQLQSYYDEALLSTPQGYRSV